MMAHERTGRSPIAYGALVSWLALLVAFSVAGCSSVPDAVNPVEWYKSSVDFFVGDDEETEGGGLVADRSKRTPGADKPIPKLSNVPERPTASKPTRQIVEGLVADRERARYSTEVIRRQGEPAQPLSTDRRAVAATPPPPPSAGGGATAPQAAAIPTAPPRAPAVTLTPPSPETSVEAIYRSRLAQQRPGRLTSPTGSPANAAVPGASAPDTVIVSSLGVSAQAAPRPAAATPTFSVPSATTGPGGSVRIATIIFAHGSSRVDARDRGILENVVKLHAKSGGKIRVVGHASSRTRSMSAERHATANQRVSQRRADAVARELTRQGLGGNSLIVVARSDSDPVYYEVMPSGEAGNRRAEVFLDY